MRIVDVALACTYGAGDVVISRIHLSSKLLTHIIFCLSNQLAEVSLKQIFAPLFVLLALFIGACSQTPRVSLKEYQEQDTGLVAKHWRDLADITVEKYTQNKMGTLDGKLVYGVHQVNAGPVYIQKGLNDSAFDRSFHTYLTTAFLKRGISVSKQPTKATVFNYSAETYLYSRINGEKTPLTYASFWAVLNKIRVDNKTASTDMIANNFLAYGLIWDYFAAKNNVTDAEVVLTISVEEANTVKYKDSTEFYIERNDLPLYWSDKPASPIRLDGAQSDKPLKTVSIPVTK